MQTTLKTCFVCNMHVFNYATCMPVCLNDVDQDDRFFADQTTWSMFDTDNHTKYQSEWYYMNEEDSERDRGSAVALGVLLVHCWN